MKDNFNKAIVFTLNWETGFGKSIYSNNQKDPGGETKWGISKRAFPNLNIKNLTKNKAIEIYKSRYWDAMDCDNLPHYIDVVAFDIAVNQGLVVARKALAKLKEYAKYIAPDVKLGALFLIIESIDIYDDLSAFNTFGKGWVRRRVSLAKYIFSDFNIMLYDD